MNERSPRGNNPDDKLTAPKINAYAKSGVNYMAGEGTGGASDNPQNIERSWDPVDTDLNSGGEAAEQTPLEKIKAGLYRDFEQEWGRPPQSVTERGLLDWAAVDKLGSSRATPPQVPANENPLWIQGTTHSRDAQYREASAAPGNRQTQEAQGVKRLAGIDASTPEGRAQIERIVNDAMNSGTLNLAQINEAVDGLHKLIDTETNEGDEERHKAQREALLIKGQTIQRLDAGKKLLKDQGVREEDMTPELIEAAADKVVEPISQAQRIEKLKRDILISINKEEARNKFEWLRKSVRDINENIKNGNLSVSDTTRATLESVASLNEIDLDTIEKIQAQTLRIVADNRSELNIKKFFINKEVEKSRGRMQIQSLEDLVELISESQQGEFLPGKKYAIMNEKGEVQMHNLVAWIRNRILASHNSTPDGTINIFSQIRIPTAFQQITLNDMLFIPSYFQKRKVVISGNEESATMKYENSEDVQYNQFKNDLLYEAWLFEFSHNNDAEYRSVRGQEEPLFNKLNTLLANNQFTKGRDRLLNVLSLAKTDAKDFEAVGNREKQGSVGKAIQRGIMAYYHLSELVRENPAIYDVAKDVRSPENNNFFATLGEDGTRYFYQSIAEQLIKAKTTTDIAFGRDLNALSEGVKGSDDEKDLSQIELLLKYKKAELGSLLEAKIGISLEQLDKYEQDPRVFAEILLQKVWNFKHKDLNIFDLRNKEQRLITLVSKAISQSTGKKEGLGAEDMEYAGTWAFTMRNWTGIAARNDTKGIGFDAWSKLINFKDYRWRQGNGRSGAGNRLNFPGFERLSMTLLDGLTVKVDGEGDKKRSLTSVLEESVRGNTDIKVFDFEGEAMSQFAGNHISNAYKVFLFILEKQEFKMHSFLKEDIRGNLVFDQEAAFKLMDGPWHDIRYAFDQQGFDYDHTMIKGWVNEEVWGKDGKPTFDDQGQVITKLVYKEQSLREYMFGKPIRDLVDDLYKRPIVAGKDGKGKDTKMARPIFAYLLAEEIKAHRTWGSGYPRWTIEHIQQLEEFFRQQSLQIGQAGVDNFDMKNFEKFFNKEEWREILKAVDITYGKMYAGAGAEQVGGGLLTGVLQSIGETVKQATKMKPAA